MIKSFQLFKNINQINSINNILPINKQFNYIYNNYAKKVLRKPLSLNYEDQDQPLPIKIKRKKSTTAPNRNQQEVVFDKEEQDDEQYDEDDYENLERTTKNSKPIFKQPKLTKLEVQINANSVAPTKKIELFKKRSSDSSQGILSKGMAHSVIKNQWMKRQMTDPYVAMAKKDSLISRAAFKLMNIDQQINLFKAGNIVIDLGASPGGWSQYIEKTVVLNKQSQIPGMLISVDINPKFELPDKSTFIHGDFTEISTQNKIKKMIQFKTTEAYKKHLASNAKRSSLEIANELKFNSKMERFQNEEQDETTMIKADVIVSDMAPSYSGIQKVDHSRLIELQTKALEFALKNLKVGGSFVCKVSRGGEEKSFFKLLEQNFVQVKSMKPEASRLESTEIYYIGKKFIGQ